MSNFKILQSCHWPTDEFPFASVDIRMTELARRLSIATQKWNEDGLGPAEGAKFRTKQAFIFLFGNFNMALSTLDLRDQTSLLMPRISAPTELNQF
jgi:hypothetical protein